MALQQRFNAEQQQVVSVLSDAYKKALELCRTKYKIDVIMTSESVVSYNPEVDVTDKVLAEMNAQPLDFKPMTAENAGTEKPVAQ